MKIKTSELEGAALDWAVAQATKAWDSAHTLFPTWTMDATFLGVQPMVYSDGQAFCQLVPSNPMRQDPQRYSPSTDWAQGGPLIDRHEIDVWEDLGDIRAEVCVPNRAVVVAFGKTRLIAACRAIVAAKLGDEVEIPDELTEQ